MTGHFWRHEALLDTSKKTEMPATVLVRRLLTYLKPYKTAFIGVVVLIIINSITSLGGPYILGMAIDNYILRKDLNGLIYMSVLYLIIMIIQWIAQSSRSYLLEWIGQKFLANIRKMIFDKLLNLHLGFYDKSRAGDLISIAINDTSTLQEVMISGVFSVIGDILTLAGVLVAMFMLNIPLTLASLTVVPLMILVAYIMSSRFRRAYRLTREKISKITQRVQESVSGIRVVQAFSREDVIQQTFRSASLEAFQANVMAGRLMALFWPIMRLISILSTVIVLWYGGYLKSMNAISVGVLVAFLSYVSRFTGPITNLVSMYDAVQAAFAASERIFRILDEEVQIKDASDAIELPKVTGKIEYKNVYFEYIPGIPVLKNINLKINLGEKVAVVGPTGAGKTTLVYLLCRFYDVKSGYILIDGHDIKKIKQKSLRSHIGFVPQETYLFPGSIMENIRIGKPSASDEEVIKVCKRLGIHEFIMRLPRGYDTDAGEAGIRLSTGEKQLISFARAMLRDPPILILDEAISSVDAKTEQMIINAIKKLLEGRTAIIIAHRLSMVRDWDRIVVLENGEIVEEGTHEELMAKRGMYYNFYKSQMKAVEVPSVIHADNS